MGLEVSIKQNVIKDTEAYYTLMSHLDSATMTGIEPLIDPAAGGLVSIIFDIAKRVGGGSAQALSDRAKATTALKKYTQRYASRYGVIRILGMRQDLPLETIYTKVRFLDELSIRRFGVST
jgi:hypothetical protein